VRLSSPPLAAALAAAALACHADPPPLASCKDSLAGVWDARLDDAATLPAAPLRADERLAFDVREENGALAFYPLWDSARPPGGKTPLATDPSAPPAPLSLSPWRITLTHAGDAAVGQLRWRVTQAGKTCAEEQPARLSACQNASARLELTYAPRVDASTCALPAPPVRLGFTLHRSDR
jgi:hypothetical protein